MSVTWMRLEPSFATTLERVPCSPVCHLAPLVLHAYPTLVVAERRLPAAHTGSHACQARRCPLRGQDASFWWRRMIQRERGAIRAPQHVPDVIRSYESCVRLYARSVQQPLVMHHGRVGPTGRALSRSRAPMEWVWARCLCLIASL